MTNQDLLASQFSAIYDVIAANLDGMSAEASLIVPPSGGNTANWVLGHLISVHNAVMGLVGEPPVMPADALAGAAPEPADRPAEPMDWEAMTTAFLASRDRCLAGVRAVTDATMDEMLPHPFGGEASRAELLGVLAFHQAYHAGQFGLARRTAGMEGAIKGPSQVARA